MTSKAFNFMKETRRPNIYADARAQIYELVQQIEHIYKTQMRRSCGHVCDICGAGDLNERCRVSDCILGYEHRDHESPRLCYNHNCGWRSSFGRREIARKGQLIGINHNAGGIENKMRSFLAINNTVYEKPVFSDEEVDLQFAQFLAYQLNKAARISK